MFKVLKILVPPSDHPTSTATLRNVGGAPIVVDTASVEQMNAGELRDVCDNDHLCAEDEQIIGRRSACKFERIYQCRS